MTLFEFIEKLYNYVGNTHPELSPTLYGLRFPVKLEIKHPDRNIYLEIKLGKYLFGNILEVRSGNSLRYYSNLDSLSEHIKNWLKP